MKLILSATTGKEFLPLLRRTLPRAAELMRSPLRELSVVLVGDARMSRLHEQFMNISGPTDVLTFPLDIDNRNRVTSGEIVVCVPEARRRARSLPHAISHEVLLYCVHGMLHLSGEDDTSDSGYRKMHKMEDDILTRLGFGPVFSNEGSGVRSAKGARQ